MLNKVLVIFFGVLFFIVIIEIGYLFFYKPSQKAPAVGGGTVGSVDKRANAILDGLDSKGDLVVSSVVTTEYRGICVEVLGPGRKGSVKYDFGIILKPESGTGKSSNFLYGAGSKVNIYEKVLGVRKKIGISQIKPGDVISIQSTIDIKNYSTYNRAQIDITKQ